jgi:antitoxin component HigA of HigAB toxin-antitoxin module
MDIKPIKTPAEHRAALAEIDSLMMAKKGTPDGDRLDVLATLVETYEASLGTPGIEEVDLEIPRFPDLARPADFS